MIKWENVVMKVFENRKQNKQLGLTYAVFLMNGMLALSIGSLLPFVRDTRGLDYGFCGLIVSLHSVGNLFSSFFAGTLPLVIGKKEDAYCLTFEDFVWKRKSGTGCGLSHDRTGQGSGK